MHRGGRYNRGISKPEVTPMPPEPLTCARDCDHYQCDEDSYEGSEDGDDY